MKARPIHTVDELIEALLPHKGKQLKGTWESQIIEDVYVYESTEGILIDLDNGRDQLSFQDNPCMYCGESTGGMDYFTKDGTKVYHNKCLRCPLCRGEVDIFTYEGVIVCKKCKHESIQP